MKKYVGLDQLIDELVSKLGNIHSAYITGDYAEGIDSGLIDLILVGNVNEEKLKKITLKIEHLINRKIRTLILSSADLKKLSTRLNIKNSLYIWGKSQN